MRVIVLLGVMAQQVKKSLDFVEESEEGEDPNAYLEAWNRRERWLADFILWLYDGSDWL